MQVSLNHVFTETSGAGSDGDCSVHPEHSRRASRSCALYLHQPGSPLSGFSSKPFSVPDKHGSQAARQHELGKQQQARRRFWGQREYQGERSLLHGKCFSWQERFRKTDRALEEVPTWPNVGQLWMTTNTEMIHNSAKQ